MNMFKKILCLAVIVSCSVFVYAAAMAQVKYNSQDEAITGTASEEPDRPVQVMGSITESISPSPVVTESPLPDAPLPDETLREVGVTESPEKDTTPRSIGIREDAGPDTTGRSAATDDSGVQEKASPYPSTPDIFTPKKKQ